MERKFVELAVKTAGLGGLGLVVALWVFRDIIRQKIFPKLPAELAHKTIKYIIFSVTSLAGLSILTWGALVVYSSHGSTEELHSGHIIVYDGFKQGDQSGFNFQMNSLVPWHKSCEADILVARPKDQQIAYFFTQYEAGEYSKAECDKNARGGIIKLVQRDLDEVKEAPISGYTPYWIRPEKDAVYCVRTRDGNHYAKIQVTAIEKDKIGFSWVYQSNNSRKF